MHWTDYVKKMQIVTPSFKLVTLKTGKIQDYFTLRRCPAVRLIIHLIIHVAIESIREKWRKILYVRTTFLNYSLKVKLMPPLWIEKLDIINSIIILNTRIKKMC